MSWIVVVFLLSGATSLVYQVIWVRKLSLFLGSDVYAAALTLSVFMGGLSIGSWMAGRVGDRTRRPLVAYGFCEVGVAVLAIAFPWLLDALRGTYETIYRAHFDTAPWLYHLARLGVASVSLLLPTALMGATLPLLVRQFVESAEVIAQRTGFLYAVNTLGALLGTVATGFVLLPTFGVSATVWATASVNLAIGGVAVAMGFRSAADPKVVQKGAASARLDRVQRLAIVAIALSGFAALALEVVWTRLLVQSFSATVYAFAIMLASFLLGLYLGSQNASAIVDRQPSPIGYLVALELWLGASVTLLAVASYAVPALFGHLVWGLTGVTAGAFGASSVVAQFAVAVLLLIVPTMLLGATFPTVIKIVTPEVDHRANRTGMVYAANTAGALLGSLAGGFAILPTFGARIGLLVIALVFACSGAIMMVGSGRWSELRRPAIIVPVAVATLASVLAAALPNQRVLNFNMQRSSNPRVLYHGEGVAHTIDVVQNDRGHIIMAVNGNIEADTTLTQRRHFVLKAHLPLLLHPEPKTVAIVGLGLGITLRSIVRHPGIEQIRLIELAPEMVEAHAHLRDLTDRALEDRRLQLRIDDGRNFMTMSDERFDLVTADPIHPRITGVGYLYTREYYQAIRNRLRPGGIVLQWMPMYSISPASFDVAFRTFALVFPHASFWYVRGHGLFVATLDDFTFDYGAFAERFMYQAVRDDFASIGIGSPEELLGHLLMDAAHVKRYVERSSDRRINTDDNAHLEYRTPFEFTQETKPIVAGLLPYSGWDAERVMRNATVGVHQKVREQFERRRSRLLAELAESVD